MGSPDPQCRDGRPKLSGWMRLATLRAALLAAAAGVGWLGDLLRRMMGGRIRSGGGGQGDPFEVLGLQGGEEGSTMEEATKARRKLALKWHPDRNIGNEEEATKKMQEINAAYNEVQQILSDGSNGVENDDEASESEDEYSNDTHNRTGNQKKEEKKRKKKEYREQQKAEKNREQKMKEEFSRFQKAHRAAQRGAFASSDNAAGGKQNVAPRQKGVKNRGTTKGAKKRAKKRAKKEEQKREQAWEKKRQEYAKEGSPPGMNEDAPGVAPTAKKRTPFHRLSPEMRCGIKFGSNALLKTPIFTAIRARTWTMLHLGLRAMRKHACDPIPLPEEGVIVTPLMIACYLGDGAAANILIQTMIGGRWAEAVTAKTREGQDSLELALESQGIAEKLYEEAQMDLEGMATKKDLERQQKVIEERRKAVKEATDLVGRISTLQQHARKKRRKRNIKVYSAISVVGIILPGSFFFYPEIAKKLAVLLVFGMLCWAAPAIWVALRIFVALLQFFVEVICIDIKRNFN